MEGPDADSGQRKGLGSLLRHPETLLNATGVLLLGVVAVGAALLLPPSNFSSDLPGDDQLDSLSTRSIKAPRDFSVPDPETTGARRAAAAALVRPVYDFDAAVAERARARIGIAFRFARDRLAEELALARKVRGAKDVDANDPARLASPYFAEFIKQLQTYVDPSVFADLARLSFDEPTERATVQLTGALLSEEIVERRELLLAEHERGITVRTIGEDGDQPEREARDIDQISDVNGIRELLARIATGAPIAPDPSARLSRIIHTLPEDLPPAARRPVALLASALTESNLQYNRTETEVRKTAAAVAVKPVVLQYARGERIVGDGERIAKRHLVVFKALRERARTLDELQVRVGAALFAVILSFAVYRLARRTIRRFRPGKRDLLLLAAALLANLSLQRLMLAGNEALRDRLPELSVEVGALLLPLAAGTMLVRMLRSGESSIVFALIFAPLAAVQLSAHEPALVGLIASISAAERLGRRAGRAALPLAAVQAGLTAALASVALSLFAGRLLLPQTLWQAAAALVGAGLLSPLAALLLAPLFETAFGYTSEWQLVRLSSLNHPVLKELIIKAPGTYHHSLIVGSLAEAAARRVGAHPLLAKVGGYYHDVGKADAPLMFSENQKTENRLERLVPEEAAHTLHRHVSAGLARARDARLPRPIQDFIAQHHGTRLAGDFFERACEAAKRDGRPMPSEADFRYPGPKPRTRETALVLLADCVEAAARAVPDQSPETLKPLVDKVIQALVIDGQLDECDLTLADVRQASLAMQDVITDLRGLGRVDVLPTMRSGGGGVSSPGPLRLVRSSETKDA